MGSEDAETRSYMDGRGRILTVESGLADENGHVRYGTFWRSAAGGKHRVKTPALQMRGSFAVAQADLDRYAARKKFPIPFLPPHLLGELTGALAAANGRYN